MIVTSRILARYLFSGDGGRDAWIMRFNFVIGYLCYTREYAVYFIDVVLRT